MISNVSRDDKSSSKSNYSDKGQTIGGFLDNDGKYAWMAQNNHLTVINVGTGKYISTWNFNEQITCASPFPSQPGEIPLLLIGFDNNANRIRDSVGQLCIYDSSISCVLRVIQVNCCTKSYFDNLLMLIWSCKRLLII